MSCTPEQADLARNLIALGGKLPGIGAAYIKGTMPPPLVDHIAATLEEVARQMRLHRPGEDPPALPSETSHA